MDTTNKSVTREPAINQPQENLIHESMKKNAALPPGGKINIKPNTYDRIETILKAGGMDSMSQQKALSAIREILNEESQSHQEEQESHSKK